MNAIEIIGFLIVSLVSTFVSIKLAARESALYKLNVREMGLVYFLSVLFTTWILWSRWGSNNFYAIGLFTICFSVLSVSFYIDIKLQELPDVITIIVLLCVVGLLAQPSVLHLGWKSFLMRFLLASSITAVCFVFSVKTENLGMGDVKLLFPMLLLIGVDTNILTGGYKIIYYLYNVLMPAFVVSLAYLAIHRSRNLKIAFGPFMILGFVLTFSVLPVSIFML